MRLLYSLFFSLVKLFLPLIGLFNSKIRHFLKSRQEARATTPDQPVKQPLFWMHVASLGEYEQGLPLLRKWKEAFPEHTRLLTFFSPSGYELKKNTAEADYITYLPLDTSFAVQEFLTYWNPTWAVFVKYEIWPNLLWRLHQRGTPAFLISARFHKEQIYFKSYGGWMRKHLDYFQIIFAQNQQSVDLLSARLQTRVLLSGDSRFDRVEATRLAQEILPFLDVFKADKQLFVIGSHWPEDEVAFLHTLNTEKEFKWLIAPHQLQEEQLLRLLATIKRPYLRYSEMTRKENGQIELNTEQIKRLQKAEVLLLDTIGLLSRSYQYADAAYIGGGFATGLHNILEAVVFGIPVWIGPNYKKFPEAGDLVERGGIFSIRNAQELSQRLRQLQENPSARKRVHEINREYCLSQLGTTEQVFREMEAFVKNHLD